MKKIIGVTGNFVPAFEMGKNRIRGLFDQDMMMLATDYFEAIHANGGVPLFIPTINDSSYIENIINSIDGLLIAGGCDIGPEKYKTQLKVSLGRVTPERDDFEFALFQKALEKKLGVLGICRGLQLINVAFGGTLFQDIYNERKEQNLNHSFENGRKNMIAHSIKLEKEFEDIFEAKEISVNSFHHQAIETLGENLKAVAFSEDGLIEGIISTNHNYVKAVQWHPEMMFKTHKIQNLIFKDFICSLNKG